MNNDESRKYAPVLQRTVELLGKEGAEKLTFGAALVLAASELNTVIPKHLEAPLLLSAFKIIAAQRIPGAPDA
jgi:hypothetical protein